MIEKNTYLLLAPWLLIVAMLNSCSDASNEPDPVSGLILFMGKIENLK